MRWGWWRVATLVLLIVALSIAISAGRTIEAIIIGIFTIPSAVLVGAAIYERARGRV